jgi:RHS repeat-associated protein
MLAAAESARASYVRMNKQAANAAAGQAARLLPESAKQSVLGVIGGLTDFKTSFRGSLTALANEQTERGIAWLLRMLLNAVKRHKKPKAALVSPQGTRVQKDRPNQPVEAIAKQAPARGDGVACKLCPAPAGTKRSISYATGAESLSHADFVLSGSLPLVWSRTYRSQLEGYEQGQQGARWLTPFHTRVDAPLDGKKKSLIYRGSDGRSHNYPWLEVGESHYDPIEERTLTRVSASLLLIDPGKPLPAGQTPELRETYELVTTVASKAEAQGPQHFRLIAFQTKEAGIGLRYDHQVASGPNAGEHVLSDILSKQGDKTQAHVAVIPDEQGRIQALWQLKDGQPERQLAAYTYNEHGDLVSAQDENAATWTYQYDHHLITRYSDRTGRGINLQYDGTGPQAKAIREWADDGSFDTRLEWDKNIRLTYVTDAHGEETWVYYDIAGYPYRIIHPDHNEEWFFRDDAKNVTRHVHTDGSTDDYHHDDAGNLIAHVRADGSRVHYEYDDNHRLTGILDPDGHTWKRSYNPQGQLEEETDPRGNKTQYVYDKAGRVSEVIDAKGGTKKLSYTEQGQLARYTDCSGRSTQWEYDERGRLIKTTDAAKHSTVYRYTPVNEETLQKAHQEQPGNHPGQLEAVVYADQSEEHLCHDAEGRLLKHTDALKRSTSYNYNAAGLIAQRTDALGQQLSYAWDKLGRLKELKNENGRPYSFKYDPVGRLLEEVGFDGQATKYSYAEETGVLQEVKEGTLTTKLEFDEMGRLSKRTALLPGKEPQTESFGYYPGGQLGEAKNEHARLQWFYDEAGNLVREHHHYLGSLVPQQGVAVWNHRYNELNLRVGTTRPDGHQLEWLMYGSGHVHGLMLDGQDVIAFERDALHREVHRLQGNGLEQGQRYDPLGRLVEQQVSPSEQRLRGQMGQGPFKYHGGSALPEGQAAVLRHYRYDKAGQLDHIEDSRRGRIEYRYDPVGRLLQANSALGRESFAFDPASNIVPLHQESESLARRQPLPKLLDNLLKEYAGTHYRYDERGNLIERVQQGKKAQFEWDGFNRMAKATTPTGTIAFAYDPLGRRIVKRRDATTAVLFSWDGDTLALESQTGQQSGTVHYIHEWGSFVPMLQAKLAAPLALMSKQEAEDDDTTPAAEPLSPRQVAHYQCDHLGTPQELTDHEGQVAWAAQYWAWGQAREVIRDAADKAGFSNPIRFQGQYLDEETGLHYNRHRYYDPHAGRFVSKDPIGLWGGYNVFMYAPNTTEWSDPLGLAPRRPAHKASIERKVDCLKAQGFQEHHIISDKNAQTKNHPLIALAGFDLQSQANKIYLPDNENLHPTRSIHNGRHPNVVSTNLARQMNDAVVLGRQQGWGQKQYDDALRGIIAKERIELKAGNRMLNKNHRPWACPN